jgi:hypothetical protein
VGVPSAEIVPRLIAFLVCQGVSMIDAADCVQETLIDALPPDAGLNGDSAWLVAVGVVGMSEHSARYWLTRRHELPKEDAVALTATLAWQAWPASRCSSGPVRARRWGS